MSRRRLVTTNSSRSLWLCLLHALLALSFHLLPRLFSILSSSSLPFLFSLIFLLSALYHLYSFLFPLLGRQPVQLNARQMSLLHLDPSSPPSGFALSPKPASRAHPNPFKPLDGPFTTPTHGGNTTNTSPTPPKSNPASPDAPLRPSYASFNSSITSEAELNEYLDELESSQIRRRRIQGEPQSPSSSAQSPNATMHSFWKPGHQTAAAAAAANGGGSPSVPDYSPLLTRLSYQV